MLLRDKFPRQKDIFLLNDVPVQVELQSEEKFSSASNISLLQSFRTGHTNIVNTLPRPNFTGISLQNIHYSYLDYGCYGKVDGIEKNYDFVQEIFRRKDLLPVEGEEFLTSRTDLSAKFFKFSAQDIYISERLWLEYHALLEEIRLVKPKLIIVTGKWGLFFLTELPKLGETMGHGADRKPLGGLQKYRASVLRACDRFGFENHILVPIWHTVHIITMSDKAPIIELDLQRISDIYDKIGKYGLSYYEEVPTISVVPTTLSGALAAIEEIKDELDQGEKILSCDIEVFFLRTVDCLGLALSPIKGYCFPFATIDNPNFWTLEEETEIMAGLFEILTHPNALHLGQNYAFDCQFFYTVWGLHIFPRHDTLVLHHILYDFLPKDLAFLASLYCEFYTYWKDEIEPKPGEPEKRWLYNVKDVTKTLEIFEIIYYQLLLKDSNPKLPELYEFQIMKLQKELIKTMNRGVKVDIEQKKELFKFFSTLLEKMEEEITEILGFPFNSNSVPQKKKLFKDFFNMTLKTKRRKGAETTETCDAVAMLEYIEEYPLFAPFLGLLMEQSALKVFVKTFLGMELDEDSRMRTQYKIAGTHTGRLGSTKNIYGKGGNLMNLPVKGKFPLFYALELLQTEVNLDDLDDSAEYILSTVEGTDDEL